MIDISNLFKAQNTDVTIPPYEGEVSVERAVNIMEKLGITAEHEIMDEFGIAEKTQEQIKIFITKVLNKEQNLITIIESEEEAEKVFNKMRDALGWFFDLAEENTETGSIIFLQLASITESCPAGYSRAFSTLYAQYCLNLVQYSDQGTEYTGIIEKFIYSYKSQHLEEVLREYLQALGFGDPTHIRNYVFKKMINDNLITPNGLDEYDDKIANNIPDLIGKPNYDKLILAWKNTFDLDDFCSSLKKTLLKQKNFWIYLTDTITSRRIANPEDIVENPETYERLKNSIILLLLHELGYIEINSNNLPNGKLTTEDINKLDALLIEQKRGPINDYIQLPTIDEIHQHIAKQMIIDTSIGLGVGIAAGFAIFGIIYGLTQIKNIPGITSTIFSSFSTSFSIEKTNLSIPAFASIIIVSTAIIGAITAASIDAYEIYKARFYL